MKTIEITGKTIDGAIEQGLKELKCIRDEVEVEIIEAPSRGLFGLIGAKAAKIKLSLRDKNNEAELFGFSKKQEKTVKQEKRAAKEEVKSEHGEQPETVAISFLNKIFEKLDVKVKTEVSKQEDFLYLAFNGDDLGILIGRRGETLDSLQYLTNLVVGRKFGQKYRIILDVEGYRKRREQTLVNLAYRLSEKVKRTGHNIVLEPMNPHERRIIHTALQNDQKVRTFSEGEEPYRKVIITRKAR
ncbi:MAG: RNA-binding cell elongation regulator Jag/EloR [Dehalobacterium sp.]